MKIQSLSVVVPGGCPNNCHFCVSKLHPNPYVNQIEKNTRFRDVYRKDYIQKMNFARDNGCNTVILTGNGEPVLNREFLNSFSEWNGQLDRPFRWIELQTSGVTVDEEKLRWLRNTVGVSTISLSLSSVFDSEDNASYNRTPGNLTVNIDTLCAEIKRYDFTLRLSLNLTDRYEGEEICEIFDRCSDLGANQITFRVLYESGTDSTIDNWIKDHRCYGNIQERIQKYINQNGNPLERLPFGATRHSVRGMSVVIDSDCMSKAPREEENVKYLILQPNCKLYSRWDDPGSIMF